MPAQKGNQYAAGNKGGGRNSLYKDEYVSEAFNYCLLGATDKDLAIFFEVSEHTINNWKMEHEDFYEALKKGKYQADAMVASKLFRRACGYDYMEDQAIKLKAYDEEGRQIEKVEMVTVRKIVPPDSTSCFFWLKNRKPDKWRDKQDINLSGNVGIEVTWQE
jgi:hypothetical protein